MHDCRYREALGELKKMIEWSYSNEPNLRPTQHRPTATLAEVYAGICSALVKPIATCPACGHGTHERPCTSGVTIPMTKANGMNDTRVCMCAARVIGRMVATDPGVEPVPLGEYILRQVGGIGGRT